VLYVNILLHHGYNLVGETVEYVRSGCVYGILTRVPCEKSK
jgi:hypothetical protein